MKYINYILFFALLKVEALGEVIPRPLTYYNDADLKNIYHIILHRISVEPFNLIATLIFFAAVIHTFLTSYFLKIADKFENTNNGKISEERYMMAKLFHFIGEIETVFGLWTIALAFAAIYYYDWESFVEYVGHLHYIEPMFVVVIMTISASRPVIKLFELIMWKLVKLFGGTLEAWWVVILTVGPLLGSVITEPAAMTISAHLLADKFFDIKPGKKMKYITTALLFVNVSVGGTLTNFAAPPILMVAGPWSWTGKFMFSNFGVKALIGILLVNFLYFFLYRKELHKLKEDYVKNRFKRYIQRKFISRNELEERLNEIEEDINNKLGFTNTFQNTCQKIKDEIRIKAEESLSDAEIEKYDIAKALEKRFEDIKNEEMKKSIPGLMPKNERPSYRDPNWDNREDKVPYWIMIMHMLFIVWTVFNSHEPVLFIGGFLFFLAFVQVTAFYQNRINLKPALLVAFFLSGLIIHGSVQSWWIEPVLGNLSEVPLMISAVLLTSFNDNAAITYLSTFVEGFSDSLKYVIVAGAVTGGGLTVIANAPNPAGQSILKKYFPNGFSAFELLKAAIVPTLVFFVIFIVFR